MRGTWLFGVFVVFCTSFGSFGKNIDTTFLKKRIPEMMDSAGVQGLSIGIVKKGKLVWSRNFGIANSAAKKSVTQASVFEAASLSKPLFGYICMRLVEEGILDLDKPLVEYVGKDWLEKGFLGYKIQDNRFFKITARLCLSHSAGFPNGGKFLVYEPATDMHYSGTGISLLQFVVEALTKKNLEVLAQEYVFAPLGMDSSSYVWNEKKFANNIVNGHGSMGQTGGFSRHSVPSASFTLITNGSDYGKFLAMLLNQQTLKPETFQEMWKIQSKAKTNFLATMTWGLGFGLYETDLGRAFWHWGDMGIVKAYVVGIPDEKAGVVILTNSANGLNMAYSLVNMCVGGGRHEFFHVLNIPQYDDAVSVLMQRFSQGGIEKVLESFNYYKIHHKYKVTQVLLAQITQRLLNLGRQQEALNIAKINILEFPENADAHNNMADVFLRMGRTPAAIGCYRRALQLSPQNSYARKQLAALKAL
jgi:CubicO group peptidase (beta-lactamase class C family)